MRHRYLFTLEVTPTGIGKAYDELPSHLTLMSRFFSRLSPTELIEVVRPMLEQTAPIELTFGKTAELGPKKLVVHLIEHTKELKQLHNRLRLLLDSTSVEYEYPQFVGAKHKPHVTKREGVKYEAGNKLITNHAYLIEIVDERRVIRSRLKLGEQT